MSAAESTQFPWQVIQPPGAAKAVGYSNGIVSQGGRRLTVAGQIDMGSDGKVVNPGDIAAQAAGAFANVAAVIAEAGAKPEHMVRMRVFVTDVEAYKANGKVIGAAYRESLGRWFPAMSLLGISQLYDEGAMIEVEAEIVIPD